MEVLYSSDNVLYGRVDASLDGEQWKTIYSFDKVGTEYQKFSLMVNKLDIYVFICLMEIGFKLKKYMLIVY